MCNIGNSSKFICSCTYNIGNSSTFICSCTYTTLQWEVKANCPARTQGREGTVLEKSVSLKCLSFFCDFLLLTRLKNSCRTSGPHLSSTTTICSRNQGHKMLYLSKQHMAGTTQFCLQGLSFACDSIITQSSEALWCGRSSCAFIILMSTDIE